MVCDQRMSEPDHNFMKLIKTIVSVFDFSGEWSRPYAENGYEVIQIDIKKGKDISTIITSPLSGLKRLFTKRKIKIVYKKSNNQKKSRPKTSDDTIIRQEKVDAILDKIKASGYDSLSKEEKDYLFNASKNI